jgi:hypothetical protein
MRRLASYVLVAGLAFAGAGCGSSGKKSVVLPTGPGLSPVARHASPSRVGPGPFVPSGGFAGGGGSGLWGDGASGPDGTSLGCLNKRRYSDAFGIENRSKVAVTLTAVRGPNPAPRIIDRVATQMRLSPPQRPRSNGWGGNLDLVYRGWSAARGRPVTIPPGRIATVQTNYLMRSCADLAHGRTVTLPGWLVVAYRSSGHGGAQKLTLPGRRITLRAGPTRRTCIPVFGSASLVASDVGCAIARQGNRACHPMSHPTFGVCTVAGRLWDCGSFAGAGEPLLEICYLPHQKSHSFRTVWIDRKLGLWGAIQNAKNPGWGGARGGSRPGGVCSLRGSPRTLVYKSNSFPTIRGPATARVEFIIRDYRGPGKYWAHNAVHVAAYVATAGRVSIGRANKDSLSGTVYASLHEAGGTKQANLNGTWSCRNR